MNIKIDTYKKPEPLKVLSNLSGLKSLLKPIKVRSSDQFLDVLLQKPFDILDEIGKGFSLEDHKHIDISCSMEANIPFRFWARVGNGANCGMFMKDRKEDFDTVNLNTEKETRKALALVLESLNTLPVRIQFTNLELVQKIGNAESQLSFYLHGK